MVTIVQLEELERLSSQYQLPLCELVFCELNRTAVYLKGGEVPVSFRARFLCDEVFSQKPPMYFALPVRERGDTDFGIDLDSRLRYGSYDLGPVTDLEVDTCDCSYFRKGKRVLNLNSNQRGNCGGCKLCIHNYPLYDQRVLRDTERIRGETALRTFFSDLIFRNGFPDLSHLEQIAVVTGLFGNEARVVQHLADIRKVASEFGFTGPLFFLGFELMSKEAMREVANYAPFSFCYSLDCLTRRQERLVWRKGSMSLPEVRRVLEHSLDAGFETTFSYVVGLDSLSDLSQGISQLAPFVSRFPIVNIYQIQHPGQRSIMVPEANNLIFFLEVRRIFESLFSGRGLRPYNWENYRSLWYHWFGSYYLPE